MTDSDIPRFVHHGGASGVTGSCHRLHITNPRNQSEHHLLVDCGLFQGEDAVGGDPMVQHQGVMVISGVWKQADEVAYPAG